MWNEALVQLERDGLFPEAAAILLGRPKVPPGDPWGHRFPPSWLGGRLSLGTVFTCDIKAGFFLLILWGHLNIFNSRIVFIFIAGCNSRTVLSFIDWNRFEDAFEGPRKTFHLGKIQSPCTVRANLWPLLRKASFYILSHEHCCAQILKLTSPLRSFAPPSLFIF